MKVGDIVRFKYGEAILEGELYKTALLPDWFVIKVERPRGFTWRNDEPFYVSMPAEALEIIEGK